MLKLLIKGLWLSNLYFVYLNIIKKYKVMMSLKLQDENNGYFKIFDLRQAKGREFSDNHSPTLRSKLLEVSDCGNVCTVISVEAYNKQGGKVSKQPSYLTWNALFY